MRIVAAAARAVPVALTRPYAIAFKSIDAVDMVAVELRGEGGLVGLGTGTPLEEVTGESFAACAAALAPGSLDWLLDRDVRELPRLCRELAERLPRAPAARAAVDIALHDLWGRLLGRPLADLLGRAHDALPTSITIGIKPAAEAADEAAEYVGRGFRVLKVKTGESLDADLERLRAVRARVGGGVRIRADANQGYGADDLRRYLDAAAPLDVEFLEQPLPAQPPEAIAAQDGLPEAARRRLAADESLLDERDALRLARPPLRFGIGNIKLMKCGGIRPALRIAAIAETCGMELMWGCMDESVVSIAAALHAAFASPATRYLDLDGSFDLAQDLATGGFALADGVMRTLDRPGLGIEAAAG